MYLISTAKATILTDFENLQNKFIYYHTNSENRDFQPLCSQQCMFVEVNQKSGLEILRLKETNNQSKKKDCYIQRVRKLTIDGVYCVACSKQSLENIAVGLANGQVKLYDYKRIELIHKFPSDSHDNSVLFLDYNASDEYIAGVFENGSINIYGCKTKTKLEKFNIDKQSTLARFHPSKRFHLSIASYQGGVTVYDIQAKCKIYNVAAAHGAPCRDLCMTPAKPDILVSAGYDCLINIYDTRRKIQPTQIKCCHPLSTVALSECGQYICVGSLKGELTTYDMRNLNNYLMTKKIHENAVTRVAFAPNATNNTSDGYNSCVTQSTTALMSELFNSTGTTSDNSRRSSATKDGNICINQNENEAIQLSKRDSFGEFLNIYAKSGQENRSPNLTPQSDSFDWEVLNSKPIEIGDNNSPKARTPLILASLNQYDTTDSKVTNDSNVVQPLRGVSNLSINTNLPQIKEIKHEETEEDERFERHITQCKDKIAIDNNQQTVSNNKTINKEVSSKRQLQQCQQSENIKSINPNTLQSLKSIDKTALYDHQQQVAGNVIESEKLSEPFPTKGVLLSSSLASSSSSDCGKSQSNSTKNNSSTHAAIDRNVEAHLKLDQQITVIMNAIQSLRYEMLERFQNIEFELKFHGDRNKWELFTQNFNLWKQQNEQSEQIQEACNVLMQYDPFVNEFIRLKEENQMLKEQLNKLQNKTKK